MFHPSPGDREHAAAVPDERQGNHQPTANGRLVLDHPQRGGHFSRHNLHIVRKALAHAGARYRHELRLFSQFRQRPYAAIAHP